MGQLMASKGGQDSKEKESAVIRGGGWRTIVGPDSIEIVPKTYQPLIQWMLIGLAATGILHWLFRLDLRWTAAPLSAFAVVGVGAYVARLAARRLCPVVRFDALRRTIEINGKRHCGFKDIEAVRVGAVAPSVVSEAERSGPTTEVLVLGHQDHSFNSLRLFAGSVADEERFLQVADQISQMMNVAFRRELSSREEFDRRLRQAYLMGGLIVVGSLATTALVVAWGVQDIRVRARSTFSEATVVSDEQIPRSRVSRRVRINFEGREIALIRKGESPLSPTDRLRVFVDPQEPGAVHVDEPQWMFALFGASVSLVNALYWIYLIRVQVEGAKRRSSAV